ncbi:uncharacterized protein LOC110447346 [Mizuhopecten yessoensis]|uniref:uncharacterized protein LOC110447346 n=1 Tax=Mizuhopecten yessoensis TaxID=6573 RepID=UPI000B45C5BF|nr:uncharacterized protein LOC110447346 [Mizuhopecten yessoensis]
MGCLSSKIFPSDSSNDKEPHEKNPRVLVGDVTTKKEKKVERELKMKEKQLIRNSKAEEMSGKIMEEKERLSLGMRSRGTSQATSRAGSPTPTSHKQVHFRPDEVKMMNSFMESNSSNSNRFSSLSKPAKSSLKNQNQTNFHKVVVNGSENTEPQQNSCFNTNNNDKIGNTIEVLEMEIKKNSEDIEKYTEIKHEKAQRNNKLSTIEERANSRCSTKSEDTKKG